MFKSKRIFYLYLICAFISIFFVQTVFSQGLTPAKKTAISWVDGAKSTYEEMAKYLWDNPELSLVEFKASAKLQEYLAKNGFKIEKGISGMPTAFIATWGSGKPVIGFLAEYDALPGLSQVSGKAVREMIIQGAPGQGCGHNLFGPASVTAAIATKVAMEKHGIKGTLKVFGTPAEETLVGKIFMARDGIFDGTDIMVSWHPGDYNGVDYSTCLAMTSVKFQFKRGIGPRCCCSTRRSERLRWCRTYGYWYEFYERACHSGSENPLCHNQRWRGSQYCSSRCRGLVFHQITAKNSG